MPVCAPPWLLQARLESIPRSTVTVTVHSAENSEASVRMELFSILKAPNQMYTCFSCEHPRIIRQLKKLAIKQITDNHLNIFITDATDWENTVFPSPLNCSPKPINAVQILDQLSASDGLLLWLNPSRKGLLYSGKISNYDHIQTPGGTKCLHSGVRTVSPADKTHCWNVEIFLPPPPHFRQGLFMSPPRWAPLAASA